MSEAFDGDSEMIEQERQRAVRLAQTLERISAIQREFSQKLMEQKEGLARIEQLAEQRSAPVNKAIGELEVALRHGRDFRLLVLLLLIICSLILVFLHIID